MPDRLDDGVIYYRAKGDAAGAVVVGAILTAFAGVVLTGDGIGGIPFSTDLVVMSTYLALPLGIVLVLANLLHVLGRGPTLAANEDGILILFTRRPIGVIRWTEITGFRAFRHQGKWYLGVALEDPDMTLTPFRGLLAPVLRRFGPADAQLKIHGRMLDDQMPAIVQELEELRRVRSWRTA